MITRRPADAALPFLSAPLCLMQSHHWHHCGAPASRRLVCVTRTVTSVASHQSFVCFIFIPGAFLSAGWMDGLPQSLSELKVDVRESSLCLCLFKEATLEGGALLFSMPMEKHLVNYFYLCCCFRKYNIISLRYLLFRCICTVRDRVSCHFIWGWFVSVRYVTSHTSFRSQPTWKHRQVCRHGAMRTETRSSWHKSTQQRHGGNRWKQKPAGNNTETEWSWRGEKSST